MHESKDYCVQAVLSFLLDPASSGEPNTQPLPDIQKAFTNHVTGVFTEDETLWENMIGGQEFQFDGCHVRVEYLFACRSTSDETAERFSADKIYRNRQTLGFCKEYGIRLSGPALGKPPKNPLLSREAKKQEYQTTVTAIS